MADVISRPAPCIIAEITLAWMHLLIMPASMCRLQRVTCDLHVSDCCMMSRAMCTQVCRS